MAPKSFLLCRALQVTLACDSIRESASLSPESPWLQLEMRWKSCWAWGGSHTPPSSSCHFSSPPWMLLHSICVPRQGGAASCTLEARKARLGSGDSQGDHKPRQEPFLCQRLGWEQLHECTQGRREHPKLPWGFPLRAGFAPEGAVSIWTGVSSASGASGREEKRDQPSHEAKQGPSHLLCVKQSWHESWKLPGGMNKGEGKNSHSRTV